VRRVVCAVLDNVGLDSGAEAFGGAGVGADEEDGVVAGDGADDFVPLLLVDGGGDGLRAAHSGEDDEEVLGLADFEAEVFEDVLDAGEVVFFVDVGQGIAAGTFHELELVDVAGERGLRGVDAFSCELAAEVVLVGDGGLAEKVFDRVVALIFHADGFSRVAIFTHEMRDEISSGKSSRAVHKNPLLMYKYT
jgi:hypothetical protein